MSPLAPSSRDVRDVVRAADALTTQVRRIADALTTREQHHEEPAQPCAQHPHAPVIGGMCGGCTQYPADMGTPRRPPMDPLHILGVGAEGDEEQRTARRVSLRVLINRANRGLTLTPDEAQLLARHVATEITEANDGRKRAEQAEELQRIAHETSNRSEAERASAVQRAERAEAAIARVRAVAVFARGHDVPDAEDQGQWELAGAILDATEPAPAATEATDGARCCGKPSGAVCVHDVTPKER